jgi:hypothetical protein
MSDCLIAFIEKNAGMTDGMRSTKQAFPVDLDAPTSSVG